MRGERVPGPQLFHSALDTAVFRHWPWVSAEKSPRNEHSAQGLSNVLKEVTDKQLKPPTFLAKQIYEERRTSS